MPNTDALTIDLFAAAQSGKVVTFELTDTFFETVEQDEILGGTAHVEATVKAKAADYFEVTYSIAGSIRVACDRCLDEVTYDIETEDSFLVFYGEGEPTNDEAHILPPRTNTFDMAWDAYESIELALPLQRLHEEGGCNPEMLDRLSGEA